jgi:hypothetical protein
MFKRDTKKDKKKKAADRITNGKRKLKGAVVHSAGKSSSNKIKLSYSEHREAKASARSRHTSSSSTSTTAAAINGRRREEKHGKSHKGAGQQRSSFRMKLPTQYNDGQERGSRGGLLPRKQHQRFNTTRDNLQPPWYNAELIERFRCNSTDTGSNNFAHNTSTPPTRSVNATTPSSSSLSMLQQQQLLLPSEHILQQLDVEIQAFVSYVRLSSTEQVARWDFVQHVTDICQRQFNNNYNNSNSNSSSNRPDDGGRRQRDYYYDNNKRGWKSSNSNNDDNNNNNKPKVAETAAAADNTTEVRVIPFGSFMTLDVCTFESDVDMCLWGVVSPNDEYDEYNNDNKKSSTLLKKSSPPWTTSSSTGNDELQSAAIGIDKNATNDNGGGGGGGCPLLTESSLLRTMDAIQTAGAIDISTTNNNNNTTTTSIKKKHQTVDDQQQRKQQTTTKKKKSKSSSVTNNDNDDLFVIDRVGDQAAAIIDLCNDDDDDDNDVTNAAVVTTTTSSSTTSSSSSTTINNSSIEEEEEIIEQIIMTQEMIERITKKKSNSSTMTIQNSSSVTSATTIATASSSAAMAEDFQFVIDKEGVKEFGGYNDEEKEKGEGVIDNLLDPTITQQSLGQTDECDALSSSAAAAEAAAAATVKDVTIDGKSQRGTVVERNDDGSCVVAIDDGNDNNKDSDDDDSADKLSSYYQRHSNQYDDVTTTTKPSSLSSVICLDNDDTSDDENEYLENDSSDDSDRNSSEDGNIEYTCNEFSTPTAAATTTRHTKEVMELSVTSNANNIQSQAAVVGPRGKTRTRVVSTLLCLTRQLRMSSHYVHTIECRTKARVPIINCATRMGFEGDIAIGGHNGVDTSMYAQAQSTRYCSFAPVVVVLKIIMSQQGLDKPFTGGLGSYKLYVLVAYHIEQHLALGGNDRPSEILISLLIRYGGGNSGGGHHRNNRGSNATTDLEKLKTQDEVLRCDGGTVELTPVFRLTDCVDMFHECYDRLLLSNTTSIDEAHMSARKIATVPTSYLSRIIDCHRLKEARETSERRSRMSENSNNSRSQYSSSSSSTVIPSPHANLNDDNDNRRKVLGGQVKRGPRGGIIPKYRPDLMASTATAATTNQQDLNLLQRATKNRKNNKKQKRDAVVKEYASAYINDDNIFR